MPMLSPHPVQPPATISARGAAPFGWLLLAGTVSLACPAAAPAQSRPSDVGRAVAVRTAAEPPAQTGAADLVRLPPARFAATAPPSMRGLASQTRNAALPPITLNTVLQKAAAGAAGGIAGIATVGVPLIAAATAGAMADPSEHLLIGLVGGAYVAGTAYGVHYMGRTQGLAASPWATVAGVLAGAGLVAASGLPLLSDDEEYRRPNLLLLIPPSALATGGYLLTRRPRLRE